MPHGEIGHIEKIIETYQFRKEEKRYARRVSMDEIETKGYNLNISRYISTAQSEEEIDLQSVNAELVKLTQSTNEEADKCRRSSSSPQGVGAASQDRLLGRGTGA